MKKIVYDSQWMTAARFISQIEGLPAPANVASLESAIASWRDEYIQRHPLTNIAERGTLADWIANPWFWELACLSRTDWDISTWCRLTRMERDNGPIISQHAWNRVITAMPPSERQQLLDTLVPLTALRAWKKGPQQPDSEAKNKPGRKAQAAAREEHLMQCDLAWQWLAMVSIANTSGSKPATSLLHHLRALEKAGTSLASVRQVFLQCYESSIGRRGLRETDVEAWAELAEGMATSSAMQSACVNLAIQRGGRNSNDITWRLGTTPAVSETLMCTLEKWIAREPRLLLKLVDDPTWANADAEGVAQASRARRHNFFRSVSTWIQSRGDMGLDAQQAFWQVAGVNRGKLDEVRRPETLAAVVATVGAHCLTNPDAYCDVETWWADTRTLPPLLRATITYEWLRRIPVDRFHITRRLPLSEIIRSLQPGIESKTSSRTWRDALSLCCAISDTLSYEDIRAVWPQIVAREGEGLMVWVKNSAIDLSNIDETFWKPMLLHPKPSVREAAIRHMRPTQSETVRDTARSP